VTVTRQRGGLEIDYVQFGWVVQLEEPAVIVTRQRGGLEIDYAQFGWVVQLEEPAVIMIRQQGGLYLDSGWTMPGEQDTGNNRGNPALAPYSPINLPISSSSFIYWSQISTV